MLRKLIALAVLCVAGMAALPASAQFLNPDTPLCNNAPCFTSGNPGSVSGTFSASLGGFTPSASGARMTPLSVTTSDSSGSLPTGAVAVVSNVGATNPMYCNVNGVAATTSDQLISPNSWFAFTIPATITTLHCIATGGTTTANGVGGAGLPTGAGGGGGGGGSIGNITQWNSVALGSPSAYGTSPGAVNVPGVNAFITNTPAVTQSGTWTVQPGNTANTTPWLASVSQGGNTAKVQAGNSAATTDVALTVADPNALAALTGPSTGLAATTPTTNTYTNGATSSINTDLHGNIGIRPDQLPSVTNPAPMVGPANTTPTDCSGTITAGGTAQAAIAAQTTLHGFTIGNIDSTAGSGEPLWISFTGTAAASTAGSWPLSAPTATTFTGLMTYSTPPGFGTNHALSIIGATTGHKFSCTWW